MKVFMLIKRLHYSGAGMMFRWLVEHLAEQPNIDVVLFTYKPYENQPTLPNNIKWIERSDLWEANFFTKLTVIRNQIKINNPDISISFLLDANILNIVSCVGLRTKSVFCERLDPYKKGYYKIKLLKPIFSLANGAVYQLPKVCSFYNNVKAKTAIIPNPIAKEYKGNIKPFEERPKVIISLGRLDINQKRQDVLLRAFALIHDKYSDYELHLYGDGPDENSLKSLSNELGVEKFVLFKGVTQEPFIVLEQSQIYVLTSDNEGIPNALIEAMQVGLPCISTRCSPGGAEFLIENGKSGLLVDCGDYSDLANKIVYLIENPKVADALGKNANKIKSYLDKNVIINKWVNYLTTLINE